MIEYSLKLPIQNRLFDDNTLTFSINYIKSRRPSVFYFILHCYTSECQLVEGEYTHEILIDDKPVYTSDRSVIGTEYTLDNADYIHTFTIPSEKMEEIAYVQLELVTLGIDSENPLYFTELMLQEGDTFDGYHVPSELTNSHTIGLPNNTYANLYDKEDNYLQVIRPNNDGFHTNNIDKSECTILAPHFAIEDDVDSHMAVFLECMNQTEQTIDVLR